MLTVDGNEAVASVAYRLNEVVTIYPITPASPMGEWADQWAAEDQPNLWGITPTVVEMQSEGGAAGALHGALQAGALATTFTASQGLLLMIPNMYKIAGELTATVMHVASRALAAQALSIFGDHSDVMAARGTGYAMLASSSVQEAHDHALITQAAALESRVPFLHFFDGFRTSHEVMKIHYLEDEDLRFLIDEDLVRAHRARALSPDHPAVRGTSQNPDVYFQAREAVNPYYLAVPAIVQHHMDRFAQRTGRQYRLYEYVGDPEAERVVVLMGSGCEAVTETLAALRGQGEKVGMLQVRLFRPFCGELFRAALPATVRMLAVLDRCKEPGCAGEPLYQDVLTAIHEGQGTPLPRVMGGRYGLASKEFTPAMIKGVFDEMKKAHPRNHFTIGIQDDVTHTSLSYDPSFSTEDPQTLRALFFGLGSDGTVGANKNSIKIIGEQTNLHAQGYFVYDSKKSGSTTVSHLRFGPNPIRSTYQIQQANFVACHHFSLLDKFDVLKSAAPGAVFLLNSPHDAQSVWQYLPRETQEHLQRKRLRFFTIDATQVAQETGMGNRINTVMQTCFFAISGVLPRAEALAAIKQSITKTYGKRGDAVVRKNHEAVDRTLAQLHEVPIPTESPRGLPMPLPLASTAPEFVRKVTALMAAGHGDDLPVSALPPDGTYPSGTTQWEKRKLSLDIPVWDPNLCIQCGKCVLVCPHAVIRGKICTPSDLVNAPAEFLTADARWRDFAAEKYTLQVSPDDCTGCRLCVEICPVKSKSEAKKKAINMEPVAPIRDRENANWDFFGKLPETDRSLLHPESVKDVQLMEPLFEFSGACAGCGETPYLKLLSQLFGDRILIANATGCSSIYGGNLPTTPWKANQQGCGPAWSNSLFEDNAEFGLGMRLALNHQRAYARKLLQQLVPKLDAALVQGLLADAPQTETGIDQQRQRVRHLKEALRHRTDTAAHDLLALADMLVEKSVWIVGGDGWAYDIGFGGLDHVLASGHKVRLLVLDTEVYSNTGGQMSKATPRGAVAKFAAGGKRTGKKDLALMATTYGHAYVARIAMGGNDVHTLKVFQEAEAFDGPALIIAYSHCIAHGYDMAHGLAQQKAAVQSGYWPLFRFNPQLKAEGKNPFQLDAAPPTIPLQKYAYNETRYTMLAQSNPVVATALLEQAQAEVTERWKRYQELASTPGNGKSEGVRP